uniref:OSJNBa0043L24.7 protein n=1 Tax=Oryza sativa subsp. japonica TaxID=39947 RepID=Q7X8C4_ORYSJ|nr:OSJNBa0043L24.7 [Oryza sativa Japonica Group]CAE05689.2 OSJNBb0002J11.16 [Oryza sativa Japonica Group]
MLSQAAAVAFSCAAAALPRALALLLAPPARHRPQRCRCPAHRLLLPQPQRHADDADDAAPPTAAARPRRPRPFSRSRRRAFMDRERRLASMESKNRSKGKKSSEACLGGSHLASVQKPPRQRPKSNPPTSHQGSDSKNEEFFMLSVSSNSTPSHLSVHSSSQDKEVDGESTDEGNSGSQGLKRKGKRKKVIFVSPAKSVARVKHSDCWKLFKVVDVPSKTEKGATETKAK